MVGFIVEGATEKIILERTDFFQYLNNKGIAYISNIIDAGGNGNLLPHNIIPFTQTLQTQGATCVIILTDLDTDQCFTNTKNRIAAPPNHTVLISAKTIESWFLADTAAMQSFLKDQAYSCPNPQDILNPFEEIKQLRMQRLGIGVKGKVILANSMSSIHGFSIMNAAKHPNCPSAKYFMDKINSLATSANNP